MLACGMTWRSTTPEEQKQFAQILLWIRTVREAGAKYGNSYYGPDWLPSEADYDKSALFERIRSGLQPLPEPPPIGYSCPWYAVVEDKGPHYVYDVTSDANWIGEGEVSVAQNRFTIYERKSETDMIVGDARGTSYRFRLWFDPEWRHPNNLRKDEGGWFIQNVELA